MMRPFVGAATLAAAMLTFGGASAATFAAIAFNKETGAYGYGNRYGTRDDAEERAAQECGPGCETIIWARDACAALATGDGNGYGSGWSADENEAVSIAIDQCDAHTTNCSLLAMTCSAY